MSLTFEARISYISMTFRFCSRENRNSEFQIPRDQNIFQYPSKLIDVNDIISFYMYIIIYMYIYTYILLIGWFRCVMYNFRQRTKDRLPSFIVFRSFRVLVHFEYKNIFWSYFSNESLKNVRLFFSFNVSCIYLCKWFQMVFWNLMKVIRIHYHFDFNSSVTCLQVRYQIKNEHQFTSYDLHCSK